MAVNKRARSGGSQNKVDYMAVKERRTETLDFSRCLIFSLWIGVNKGLFGWCGNNHACMVSYVFKSKCPVQNKIFF